MWTHKGDEMIDNEFLQEIKLNENQIILLKKALDCESRYRQILYQEHVFPEAIEPIVRNTRTYEIDFSNEELLRMKIREEYKGFIRRNENVNR